MTNMRKEYGNKKGTSVYFAMENSGKLDQAKKTAALRSHQGKKEYLRS